MNAIGATRFRFGRRHGRMRADRKRCRQFTAARNALTSIPSPLFFFHLQFAQFAQPRIDCGKFVEIAVVFLLGELKLFDRRGKLPLEPIVFGLRAALLHASAQGGIRFRQ
jgi:hypothetical protein